MAEEDKSFFDPYIDEITKLETFVDLAWAGFDFARNASRVIEVVERANAEKKTERLKNAIKLESFAEEQKKNGFSYLYILSIIRLWSILEASVDDLIINILISQKMKTQEHLFKIKGGLLEFVSLNHYERAEYILEALKSDIKANLKIGVGRFETLLETVGFNGSVPNVIRRNILELSQIRNAIIHKNGKVDSRLLKSCPWMDWKINEEIVLSVRDFTKYQFTCYWYFLELSLRYETEQSNLNEVIDLQKDLLKSLDTTFNTYKEIAASQEGI
jgi:hypothetical protein